MWDPAQYQRYSGERSRPFFELLARVRGTSPRYVVDFGCGPGHLTSALAKRWPAAEVIGVDNSAQMLEAARAAITPSADLRAVAGHPDRGGQAEAGLRPGGRGSLGFQLGDVREFEPARPPDVIICSAVLQWIPDHGALVRRWAGMLAANGWLAIQVPANFDQPSHQIMRDLARSSRWRQALAGVTGTQQSHSAGEYLELLAGRGWEVDAWETTYLHVLHGDDAVLEWYKGSGLRPVIAALPSGQAAEFIQAYAARLRTAYPARHYGTVLPFRRVFAVAHRTGG